MRIVAVAIALIVLLSAQSGDALQRSSRRPVARAKAAPKSNPLQTLVGSIALNSVRPSDDLFTACARSDFTVLAWGLEGVKDRVALAKSEYETEAEFATRRQKLEDAINNGGEVIFCQPLDDNEDAPFRYDAERQVFTGTYQSHQNVWRKIKTVGTYVSRTRMGVRATVTSSVAIEYDVDIGSAGSSGAPKCIKSSYSDFTYEVPSAREAAPGLKANGYLVFVGKLVSPFIDVSDSPGEPTLDNPKDVFERTLTVYFAPRLVAVTGARGFRAWECNLGQ